MKLCTFDKIIKYLVIEYYRVDMFEFYTIRIRNGEIRIMKSLYGAITIMKDDILVLWRGREGIFALTRKLTQFSDKK